MGIQNLSESIYHYLTISYNNSYFNFRNYEYNIAYNIFIPKYDNFYVYFFIGVPWKFKVCSYYNFG